MAAPTAKEMLEGYRAAHEHRIAQGLGPGPAYRGGNEKAPLIWFDQFFAQSLEPTGTIACAQFEPLRVGATQSSIDLVIVASHSNTTNLVMPAGASITVELWQADTPDGTLERSGYSVTVTSADAREIEPDCELCRVYIGNMTKAYCVPKIKFTGTYAGGTVDVGLAHSAH